MKKRLFASRKKNTVENVRALCGELERLQDNPHEDNDYFIDVLRELAEVTCWGDKHMEEIFDAFLEREVVSHFVKILSSPDFSSAVKVQVIQCVTILLQNLTRQPSIFFLLSNNHINHMITMDFDVHDDELLSSYTSFLKTLALRLTNETVQFFYNKEFRAFPLLLQAINLVGSEDTMVRASVRQIVITIMQISDPDVADFLADTCGQFIEHWLTFVGKQLLHIDSMIKRLAATASVETQKAGANEASPSPSPARNGNSEGPGKEKQEDEQPAATTESTQRERSNSHQRQHNAAANLVLPNAAIIDTAIEDLVDEIFYLNDLMSVPNERVVKRLVPIVERVLIDWWFCSGSNGDNDKTLQQDVCGVAPTKEELKQLYVGNLKVANYNVSKSLRLVLLSACVRHVSSPGLLEHIAKRSKQEACNCLRISCAPQSNSNESDSNDKQNSADEAASVAPALGLLWSLLKLKGLSPLTLTLQLKSDASDSNNDNNAEAPNDSSESKNNIEKVDLPATVSVFATAESRACCYDTAELSRVAKELHGNLLMSPVEGQGQQQQCQEDEDDETLPLPEALDLVLLCIHWLTRTPSKLRLLVLQHALSILKHLVTKCGASLQLSKGQALQVKVRVEQAVLQAQFTLLRRRALLHHELGDGNNSGGGGNAREVVTPDELLFVRMHSDIGKLKSVLSAFTDKVGRESQYLLPVFSTLDDDNDAQQVEAGKEEEEEQTQKQKQHDARRAKVDEYMRKAFGALQANARPPFTRQELERVESFTYLLCRHSYFSLFVNFDDSLNELLTQFDSEHKQGSEAQADGLVDRCGEGIRCEYSPAPGTPFIQNATIGDQLYLFVDSNDVLFVRPSREVPNSGEFVCVLPAFFAEAVLDPQMQFRLRVNCEGDGSSVPSTVHVAFRDRKVCQKAARLVNEASNKTRKRAAQMISDTLEYCFVTASTTEPQQGQQE